MNYKEVRQNFAKKVQQPVLAKELKFKMFSGPSVSAIECQVNAWLAENPNCKIRRWAQKQDKTADGLAISVSFFYQEPVKFAVSLHLNEMVQSGGIREIPPGATVIIED